MTANAMDAVASSRVQSLHGDFTAALDTLRQASTNELSSQGVITAEIMRIALFQADHSLISATSLPETLDNEPLSDLLHLILTMNHIWTELDLVEPVTFANNMFDKYSHALTENDIDEFVLRILFYCIVIHDWHRMYGDGLPHPHFQWDELFLRTLISKLAQHYLYLEMLDVLEYLVENPNDSLKSFAASLQSPSSPIHCSVMLCLARVQCSNGELEQATTSLQSTSFPQNVTTTKQKFKKALRIKKARPTSLSNPSDTVFALHRSLIEQRYLAQSSRASDRVVNLLQLAEVFMARLDYLTALKALEHAAELLSAIPDLSLSLKLGVQVHQLLDKTCLHSGDRLSKTLVEFRYCDLLNSAGGDFAIARERRGNLLSMPVCEKLPHIQKFHRRQWTEYYMLHQRQPAVVHAEKYYAFCQRCKSGQEQSRAQGLLFQSLLLPERVSDESRLNFLEGLRRSILQAIGIDETNNWLQEAVEKQLLLVEIAHEIGRLEEEDADVIASDAINILNSAEATLAGLPDEIDCVTLRCQTDFLKTSASLFLSGDQMGDHDRTSMSHRGVDTETSSHDYTEKVDARVYLLPALTAIMNGSLAGFKGIHDELADRSKQMTARNDLAREVMLLSIKGQIYYFLTTFEEERCRQFWMIAGVCSAKQMSEEALQCFEEAAALRTKIALETRERGKPQSMATALASSQDYHASNAQAQLDFDMAIELAFNMSDSLRTWQWIQRGKAFAFTQMLTNSLSLETALATKLLADGHATFSTLQFIQSASATQLVFVDWINYGGSRKRLLMSICRVVGRDRRTTQLEIALDLDELRNAAARVTEARMNDSDAQKYLQPFVPVIQPLQEASEAGDILILSPTSPFHNVPLHAVLLGSQNLIERNPVVYVPSQLALSICLERLTAPEQGQAAPDQWKAVTAAAYEDEASDPSTTEERTKIYQRVTALTSNLQGDSLIGHRLTEDVAISSLDSADLFHFHGHSLIDAQRPIEQRLTLGKGYMTIAQISSLRMRAAHVCLIACSSANQDFSLSLDEPFGLMAAFLLGGAVSVLGALWPIHSSTGRLFTDLYYKYFLEHVDRKELGPIVNVAKALQYTVLEIRKRPDTVRHYHWAPYISYGSWFCRRKPGSW